VRAGDSLTMHLEVIDLRPSASRADIGFLKFRSEMRNAFGAAVMRMTATLIFARRDAADDVGTP
jgi:acyl dehydratase